jgi:predicted metalloprotease
MYDKNEEKCMTKYDKVRNLAREDRAGEYLNKLLVLLRAQFLTAEEAEKLRRGAHHQPI